MMPSNGRKALTWKINSMLVLSANQPKKAEPKPPKPNISPKKMPAISPTLSGIRSVAYTTMEEKAEAMINPDRKVKMMVHVKLTKGMAMANVTITSPFWNRYRESVAREVIPYQWQIINDERRIEIPVDPAGNDDGEVNDGLSREWSHAVRNLRVAAGDVDAPFNGMVRRGRRSHCARSAARRLP